MNRFFLITVCLLISATSLIAQEQKPARHKYLFTLEDVVQIAKEQSLLAIQARHSFRAAYFTFADYKATFLPKLTLETRPTSWDNLIQTVTSFDKDDNLVISERRTNTLKSTAGLALSQNIGFTGGDVALASDFQRLQNFLEKNPNRPATQFTTTPIRLSIRQPLNGYNQFRWLKEIEPLRYEEAKLNYIVSMETVASRAVTMFFSLAIAQVNLNMMQTNFNNQRDLFEIANGRFGLGTLTEDGLLQVQLRFMQSEGNLNEAKITLESSLSQLRSFLGFNENVDIEVLIEPEIPTFKVNYDEVMHLALTRNPDIIANQRQILIAQRDVAQAKSQTGITMNLEASFGVTKTGFTFKDAYSPSFDDREGVSLSLRVPILDWSQQRNRYRSAQSSMEVIEARVQQLETDFKQDIFLQVMRFNMQENQLHIAAMADTIAERSYDISYARYMMGKGNITDLNIADREKDSAKSSYMRELRTFWSLYYALRQLTLFDFRNNKPLEEDFDRIIGD